MAASDHVEVLRLLAKRNSDIGSQRTRVVCRLHAMLCDLAPGGMPRDLSTLAAERFLRRVQPLTTVQRARYELALELVDELRRLDAQLKESHRRIRQAVVASGTSVTELFGVGPVIASMVIGYTGDVTRFANRDRYAAYNGTAPVEFSSGGRVVHRASERGNRQLNHALHLAAICQIRQPHSAGRAYFDRKRAEGKTKKEALRSLKRRIGDAVYRQLLVDAANGRLVGPGGH